MGLSKGEVTFSDKLRQGQQLSLGWARAVIKHSSFSSKSFETLFYRNIGDVIEDTAMFICIKYTLYIICIFLNVRTI